MYGKFFASTFTGSMCGAGADIFAVWGYVVAHTCDSVVELNPHLLAAVLGITVERAELALQTLCAPDSRSRNPEHEGRRLLHEGAFTYRVVSHAYYRALRNEDDRRAYNRDAQRRSREKRGKNKMSNPDVNDSQHGQPRSAHAEADSEADTQTESGTPSGSSARGGAPRPRKARSERVRRFPDFVPTPEHVDLAMRIGADVEAEAAKFRDHEFRDPKTDANACFRTWLRRSIELKRGAIQQRLAPSGGGRAGDYLPQQAARVAQLKAEEARAKGGQ